MNSRKPLNVLSGARIVAVSFIAILTMIVITGCGKNDSKQAYKVTLLVPETGPLAFLGLPMKNSLVLAQGDFADELRQAGINLTLSFADSQGNPAVAASEFSKLTSVSGTDCVIATLSGVIGAVAPMSKESRTLLIGISPDPTFLSITPFGLRGNRSQP